MSFKDVKGQNGPVGILKKYIEGSCLDASFLFSGPEGVGKKLVARNLAKAVNCLEETLDACDRCVSCKKIDNNQHPDVHIIENQDSWIKIELIRGLQKEACLRPYEARKKVFIVDNAHRLSAEAANAILKILEEPPKDNLIILISDKPSLLFKTIISRCKSLKFSLSCRKELESEFQTSYGLDSNLAHFLAYFSEGRLGCALRIKESGLINEKNRIIDNFLLMPGQGVSNLQVKTKEDFRSYLNILSTWFRDIYLIKIGMPYSEIINYDRKDDLLKTMNRFSFTDLDRILEAISDSIFFLERNINIKLLQLNLGSYLWKG